MKFRVETCDTTDIMPLWRTLHEGDNREYANAEYEWNVKFSLPTDRIRLSEKKWNGWTTVEAAGQYEERKETKPMPDSRGMSSFSDLWPRKEKEKPMSTKQRGDVEKFEVTFDVSLGASGSVLFTRDEFRRIWEAGCKEFGLGGGDLHREFVLKEERDKARHQLAEKDAEIARLKAEGCHKFHHQSLQAEINEARAEVSVTQREVARLRDWLQKIQSAADFRLDYATSALRGEKAP